MGTSSDSKTMKKVKAEVEEIPKSRFFVEVEQVTKPAGKRKQKEKLEIFIKTLEDCSRGSDLDMFVTFASWNRLPIPVEISNLSKLLRTTNLPEICDEQDGMDILKQSLLEESKNIEIVKKENFFNEEVTEEERDIISRRVALQQRQFAAYERRETIRKSKKIRNMFEYICDEEILELLNDCKQDEDEVIYSLTKPNYLYEIRKKIALKYAKEAESYAPLMTDDQRIAYEQLLKKRSVTLRKTTNDQAKKQYRMCGRLGLDEALEQFQNNQVDPEKAFEGWSQARIKSYQMIDQNPNSYYYRFNAPGEVQRKGQWDEPEQKVFFDRLAEVGANGQWGIFSMTIPGRVGYQCSNFYRLLIETKTINDPNYVLDERGKAHYLFDKKSANGQIQKTFRTHSKHTPGSGPAILLDESGGGPSTSITAAVSPPPHRRVKKTPEPKKKETNSSSSAAESSTKGKNRRQSAAKRRRRVLYGDGGSDSNEYSDLFDDDFSGNYSTRAALDTDETGYRKSKRARRPTVAAIESGLVSNGLWSHHHEEYEIDPMCPLPGFIDPITLEQVIKPAISKYGHVMGYDSWTRCLNNWEGKQNICPLTKKALTKRDLVILTFENFDEYRDKIVNM